MVSMYVLVLRPPNRAYEILMIWVLPVFSYPGSRILVGLAREF
jgi:hypothetical protein